MEVRWEAPYPAGQRTAHLSDVGRDPVRRIARLVVLSPQCGSRVKHLYFDALVCRYDAGLQYACEHQHTTGRGVGRVMKLRRRLGISPYPFSEIPKRQRHHRRYYRFVARLLLEEAALLKQPRTVTRDLDRRIRVRKIPRSEVDLRQPLLQNEPLSKRSRAGRFDRLA